MLPRQHRAHENRRADTVLPVTVYAGLRHAGRGFRQALPVSLRRIDAYDTRDTRFGLDPSSPYASAPGGQVAPQSARISMVAGAAMYPFTSGRRSGRTFSLLPEMLSGWREKLIKVGANVVTHARYVIFQMAEVAMPKRLFQAILERIRRLRLPEMVPGWPQRRIRQPEDAKAMGTVCPDRQQRRGCRPFRSTIMARGRPDGPFTEPRERLFTPGLVIQLPKRPAMVVGSSPSGRSRMIGIRSSRR